MVLFSKKDDICEKIFNLFVVGVLGNLEKFSDTSRYGAKFYGAISKRVKNDLVKAKYEQLAREEAGHRTMLASEYKRMTGEADSPPRIPGDPEVAEGGGVPEESASIDKLIQIAIDREHAATLLAHPERACDYSGEEWRRREGPGRNTPVSRSEAVTRS